MKEAERRGKGEKRKKKWAKGKKEPSRNKEIYLVLGRDPVCQGEQDEFGNKESVWGLQNLTRLPSILALNSRIKCHILNIRLNLDNSQVSLFLAIATILCESYPAWLIKGPHATSLLTTLLKVKTISFRSSVRNFEWINSVNSQHICSKRNILFPNEESKAKAGSGQPKAARPT